MVLLLEWNFWSRKRRMARHVKGTMETNADPLIRRT
jgi:hypothetical protein